MSHRGSSRPARVTPYMHGHLCVVCVCGGGLSSPISSSSLFCRSSSSPSRRPFSAVHKKFMSQSPRNFRSGTVVSNDHETPRTENHQVRSPSDTLELRFDRISVTSRFFLILVHHCPTNSSIRTDRCPSPNFPLLRAIARSSLLSSRGISPHCVRSRSLFHGHLNPASLPSTSRSSLVLESVHLLT